MFLLTGSPDRFFWNNAGQTRLQELLDLEHNLGVAKNVILFLGDGMGVSTVTAGRIFKGQQNHKVSGEEEQLAFDNFPNVGFSKACIFGRTYRDFF